MARRKKQQHDHDYTRAVGYMRVSTEHQGAIGTARGTGYGMAHQAQELERLAQQAGVELVAVCWDVASGRKARRPGLTLAETTMRETGAGCLIVSKMDRLARSVRNFLRMDEEYQAAGVRLVVGQLGMGMDPTSPMGKFVRTVLAAAAEMEADVASERTKDGLVQARAQGKQLGGYRGGPRVDGDAVTRIKDLHAEGGTFAGIARTLTAEGVPTAAGGTWSAKVVRDVVFREAT